MSFYVVNKKQLCLLIYLWFLLMFLILNNDLGKEKEEVVQSDVLSCNHEKTRPIQSVLARK